MAELIEYIINHSERGECKCGKCFDVGDKPDPTGHTADLVFFKVALKDDPDAQKLKNLIIAHKPYIDSVDLFDGKEHSFIEIGGFIGDQGLALHLMGMGSLLGLFTLMTPENMMPFLPGDLKMQMAQSGMVSIKVAA